MSLARHTLAYWFSQVGNFALSFVTSIFIAVILGPEQRGVLVSVILVNTLAVNLTNLGLQTLAMYFTGKDRGGVSRIHTLILILVILLSVMDLAILMLVGRYLLGLGQFGGLQGIPRSYLYVALAILPFSFYSFAAQGMLAGLGRVPELSRFLFYYSAGANGANLLILGMGRADRSDLVGWLIGIWALAQVIAALGLFWMLRKSQVRWVQLPFGQVVRGLSQMLSYGFRAFLGNFASALINRNDHLFILPRLGPVGIGVYNLSAKIAELIFQPSAAFETAGYARVVGSGRQESARLVQSLFRMNFLVNLAGLLILSLAAAPFVSMFLTEYREAVLPLLILLPGTLFLSGSRMLALYFSAQLGRPQVPSAIAWVTVLFNIPMLWLVVIVRDGGLVGAASVTTASYGLMLLCYLILFSAKTGLLNPALYFLPQRSDWVRTRTLVQGVFARRGI